MTRNIIFILTLSLLAACAKPKPDAFAQSEQLPPIYPDYCDVTIPAEIAPMNFNLLGDSIDYAYAEISGENGGSITVSGKWIDIDIKQWHALTQQNRGKDLTFDVYAKLVDGRWIKYQPFKMHVSQHPLNDYGVTYRKIAPGYETFSKIGIYQRNLSNFDESPILEETAVNGQCLNCHYANRANPEQFSLHIRGANGGTIVSKGGNVKYLNTKTDRTQGACTYGYWHPDGRYCVYSLNKIYQNFYVDKDNNVEPWDLFSDIAILDTETDQLLTDPIVMTDDYETTPTFSADGKTIYFSYAPKADMPNDYQQLKYSLCSIGFDPATGKLSQRIDTIINADSIGLSVSIARPSYNGKYLMYCLTDYGTTPIDHADADLWLLDLQTGKMRQMSEVNSDEADGYHNWSSDSHWFLFGSRRDDRIYSWLYFSSIGEDGIATKPFLMPQRNPLKYYTEALHSFNAPDFTTVPVKLDPISTHDIVMSGKTIPVK